MPKLLAKSLILHFPHPPHNLQNAQPTYPGPHPPTASSRETNQEPGRAKNEPAGEQYPSLGRARRARKLLGQFTTILFCQQIIILASENPMPIRLNTIHTDQVVLFHNRPINVTPFWMLVSLVVGEGCLILLAFLYLKMVLENLTATPSNSILTKNQHRTLYFSLVISLALMGVCAAIENCWSDTAWGLYALSSILFLFFTVLVSNLDRITVFINAVVGIGLAIVLNFILTESSALHPTVWVSLLMFFVGWTELIVINLTLFRVMEFITLGSTIDEKIIHLIEAACSLLVTGWFLFSKKLLGFNWWYLVGIWVGETVLILMVVLMKLKICY